MPPPWRFAENSIPRFGRASEVAALMISMMQGVLGWHRERWSDFRWGWSAAAD
jgi:hypothetical protein